MDWITLDSVIFAPVTLYLENWINIVMLLLLETDDEIGPTFCKLLQWMGWMEYIAQIGVLSTPDCWEGVPSPGGQQQEEHSTVNFSMFK